MKGEDPAVLGSLVFRWNTQVIVLYLRIYTELALNVASRRK